MEHCGSGRAGGEERCDARVDPVHLRQVVGNLLTNVRKYGGTHIRVSLTTSVSGAVVTVEDDGPGADAAFVPFLFGRRTRSSATRHGGQKGTGLGLHIARNLVELNHGSIRYVASDLGGAGFEVELPLAVRGRGE